MLRLGFDLQALERNVAAAFAALAIAAVFQGFQCMVDACQIGRIDGDRLYSASGSQMGRIDGERLYDGSGRQIGRADGLRRMQMIVFFYYVM